MLDLLKVVEVDSVDMVSMIRSPSAINLELELIEERKLLMTLSNAGCHLVIPCLLLTLSKTKVSVEKQSSTVI